MTDRLDRIETILEATATKQAQNTEDIETLLGAVSTNEVACRELRAATASSEARVNKLTERAEANEKRFETLVSEAQADRKETLRLWNDTVTQMERDRAEAKEQADADRAGANQRFEAQMENIQRLLIELIEMNRENRKLRDRVDILEQAS